MIISSSNMDMSSNRSYSKHVQAKSSVFKWTLDGKQRQVDSYSTNLRYTEAGNYQTRENFRLLSGAFLSQSYNRFGEETADYDATVTQSSSSASISDTNSIADKTVLSNSILSILEMLENVRFKSKFSDSDVFKELSNDSANSSGNPILSLTSSAKPQIWNRFEVNSYFMEEKESTAFSTTGTVRTADGRNISFDMTMEMSRSFSESSEFCNLSQYEQILTDPLVINLNLNPTTISDKTFLFDIDADGSKEEISSLSSGSGYLSLDKNGDGIINDGSELFGSKTGNGFGELAAYDSDKNGWIDEADAIYSKLKVWTKDEHGKDVQLSLKDADVGAICLRSKKTDFSLTDDKNQLHGQVRITGMYLKESGGSGTVQQVDF